MRQSPQQKDLKKQLQALLKEDLSLGKNEYKDFLNLLNIGRLTKSENPEYHCGVFFIPFDPKTKKIFIVNHKKAKQWIVPGGHIEKGELLDEAVKREAKEELGIKIEKVGNPFLFSVMYMHNEGFPCKAHYDTWYLVSSTKLNVDLTEFNDVKWVTKQEAKQFITHKAYLEALERIPGF